MVKHRIKPYQQQVADHERREIQRRRRVNWGGL